MADTASPVSPGPPSPATSEPSTPFDPGSIDEVVHGPVRLAVMAFLSGAGQASFSELKRHAGVTDGNLSVHLRKLEDAGYVSIKKTFVGRKPLTTAALTEAGRAAWIAYLDRMGALLFGRQADAGP